MKKIVLTFGLIGGVVISALMLGTLPFAKKIGFEKSEFVGYTVMVLSFLMVFFGIRSYRENIGGGKISFGRAFAVGALITLVISVCYVATWEVMYFKIMQDFMTKYGAHELEKARAAGASEATLAQKKVELDQFEKMYKNPAINAAFTILEPLPVALIIALVSAGVLSRRKRADLELGTA